MSPTPPGRRSRVTVALVLAAGLLCALVRCVPGPGRGATPSTSSARRIERPRPSAPRPPAASGPWPPAASAPSSSPAFPYDCSSSPAATAALLTPLADAKGAPPPPPPPHPAAAFPPWMDAVCPEVVAHFTAFPYFAVTHPAVPVMTSRQAAHLVCTVKVMAAIAARVGTDLMLYHGSLIGAVRHGGPVPWDDDADLAMPFAAGPAFLETCAAMRHAFHPDIAITCQHHSVFVKVWVEDQCPGVGGNATCTGLVSQPTPKPWRWPYADIFMYRMTATQWQESTQTGGASPRDHAFPLASVFPMQAYYFGGLTVKGPRAEYADTAYKWRACRTSTFDHRAEVWVDGGQADIHLNCCEAARFVPFVVGNGTVLAGRGGRRAAMADLMGSGAATAEAAAGAGAGAHARS